jgi:hypothetical protein
MDREDDRTPTTCLTELDELSLKKLTAKETELWRRDAVKAGGLRHYVFAFGAQGLKTFFNKCRGRLSDTLDGANLRA